MRSVSFTLSSEASRTSLVPSAMSAATARAGISSTRPGNDAAADTARPQPGAADPQIGHRFTPDQAFIFKSYIRAHLSQSVNDTGAGLVDPNLTQGDVGIRVGRSRHQPESRRAYITGHFHVESFEVIGRAVHHQGTRRSFPGARPIAVRKRSVWSRLSIRPPRVVSPSAYRAASSRQVFNWALATGRS